MVQLSLSMCVDADSANTASLWEINLSVSNDSNKIAGRLDEASKLLIRKTQDIAEYNTHLSMVVSDTHAYLTDPNQIDTFFFDRFQL